jgi:class 3 adenylate cyclase/tetratricopeptide (TPR) repeat protein
VTKTDKAMSPTLESALQRLVPKEYAERLREAGGRVLRERRLVTILFSDVKGSTAMGESLDPEEVLEIMDGAFDVLIKPIYKYEGTLARLMGDAVLAFFGAPISHEDDPERACRAALDIIKGAQGYAECLVQERGIRGFNVRVGINTGLVVVGEVGSDLRVEYTAMGDAINLAARMESAADPGTVLITEETHRLIAPLFEIKSLDPIQAKGKSEPIPAYRVLAAKVVHHKVRGVSGLESPQVGREAEFAALKKALKRLQAGVGGIVTLVGEAGLGKSRLVAELRKSSSHTSMQWIEGRSLSYGTSIAYLLWLDVLRALLNVSVETSVDEVRDALKAQVRNLCPERVDDVYIYLARLMSLPLGLEAEDALSYLEGEKLKKRTFRAFEHLIECTASALPLVLVCEDLQWADPTSIDLLERLLTLTDHVGLLIICVFRPETEHGSWRIRETVARTYRHRHTDVWLRPLTTAEGQTLVDNLLQGTGLSQQFTERILRFAEGNPFYVEEAVRSLIDQGVIAYTSTTGNWQVYEDFSEVALPNTLQGVLMARIDRLQDETKRVLQVASVIGRIFLHRVLVSITTQRLELDEHLLTLQRQEMIRERVRLPELEYIFKHHLTQEAAYNGLLRKERRAYHQQVAETLEQLFPTRIDEQVELLAHHWERAGINDKAVMYLIQAGDRARKNFACTEAIRHYTLGLTLAERASLPDATQALIHEQRGRAYASIANMSAARQDLQCALHWSQLTGDKRKEAEILLDLIEPFLTGHEVGAAYDCAQTAYAIATTLQDGLLIARSTSAIGAALCVRGDLSEAHEYLQAGLAAARTHGAGDILAEALAYCTLERGWVGDFRGALTMGDEALALGEEMLNPSMVARVYLVIALSHCGLGEYEAAFESIAQAEELADKTDMTTRPTELLNSKAWVYQEIYDLERSARLNRKGVEVSRRQGEIESEANALVNLGVDHLWLGDPDRAEQCFEQASKLLDKQFGGYRWRWKTRLLAAWGELQLERGEADQALDYAEQCLILAERTSARKNQVKGWKLKGEALVALDRIKEAVTYLEKAVSMADEIGNPPLMWKSRYALAQILEQLEREEEAQQQYKKAAAAVEQTASSLSDPAMRETFLSAGPVRAVLDARG